MNDFESENSNTLVARSYIFDEEAHAKYLCDKFGVKNWDAAMSQFYITDLINILLNNTTEPLRISSHPTMYLQIQNDMACWMHAFCAVIGFSFPGNCLKNDWITALFYGFPASKDVIAVDTTVAKEMKFLDATDIYHSPLNDFNIQQGLQRFESVLRANSKRIYFSTIGLSAVSIFIHCFNTLT